MALKATRTQFICFRLTRAERRRVARCKRSGETIHQTARRVLLGGVSREEITTRSVEPAPSAADKLRAEIAYEEALRV